MALLEKTNRTKFNSAKKFNAAKKMHEENFELTTCVKQGKRIIRAGYRRCVDNLENLLRFSQREESSKIIDFEISKVIRDENGEIISSTLILKKG